MITGITRNAQAVRFAYDRTYQLTSERGSYTNAAAGQIATITNRFAYDRAGNRVSHSSSLPTFHSSSYRHTSDNQLTGIYWNSSKVTLGGDIEQAWTTLWVRVQQSGTNQPTTASIKCQRGQAVAWEVRDLDIIGSGSIMFTVTVAAVKSTNTAAAGSILIWTNSTTVTYTKTSTGSGSIKYTCDNNGNRTYKWTNGVFEARYFYDVDNQLVGISFNNDNDHSDAGDYTYEYDPFGRRIRATEDSTNRHFVYDGMDCIAELDSTGGVTKTYIRGSGLGGGIGDIVAAWSMVDGQWLYFSYNHRGDVVTVTRPDGNVTNRFEYDAFGNPLTCSPLTANRSLLFSSKEYDSRSGLSYYGFRYYDAQSGRWMTKEAIFDADANSYRFIGNSSISHIDIYGNFMKTLLGDPSVGKSAGKSAKWEGLLRTKLEALCPSANATVCVEPAINATLSQPQICTRPTCLEQAGEIARTIKEVLNRGYFYDTDDYSRRRGSIQPIWACGTTAEAIGYALKRASKQYFDQHKGCFRGQYVQFRGPTALVKAAIHAFVVVYKPDVKAPLSTSNYSVAIGSYALPGFALYASGHPDDTYNY